MPSLHEQLAESGRGIIAPGVYDAFTALIAEQAGFECLYLSGASIAYTRLGRPDIGLVSVSEVADTIALICDRVALPVIVDGDTGFGNALNVQRTIKQFERAGAAAIQLEDQTSPKRCGHLAGKSVIPADEMSGKIRAACDARSSTDFKIIARTDAIAVEGFDAAATRAEAYLDAGADVLFVEAPRNDEELREIGRRFGSRVPLVANMVEGGNTPLLSADILFEYGFRIVIFPGGAARAVLKQTQDYYQSLFETRSNAAFSQRMANLDELNSAIGLDEIQAVSKKY
ncbi:MAG: oxaloacetate decarboxylase [Paracoccaceae bacterium]